MRLSYHGLRAKDKDFNCDYKLDLDPNMPLVNVISQDIGRVLLNILNNAFQACHDKNLLGLNRGDQDVNLVGLPDGQNAVSYTHLDVYKRQVLPRLDGLQ